MGTLNNGLISAYIVATGNLAIKYNKDPDGEEPDSIHDYFGTENASGEPSVGLEQRIKRCYELAGYAVAMDLMPEGSSVVHGSWHGPGAPQRIGHAWVKLPQGLVWEPIRGLVYLEREFYAWTSAWDEREYIAQVLKKMIITHNDFGRWHESRYP